MDEQWVVERLEWWIENARKARAVSYSRDRGNQVYGFTYEDNALYPQLRDASAQTHAIIVRVLGNSGVPGLMRRSEKAYWLDEGIEFAEHALALVKTRAETRAKLGTAAPTMKADALHPIIWKAASGRWESGHYSDAVQRAATALSGYVKDLTGRYELGDSELVTQAFALSEPQTGKPRLRWPGNEDDLTVKTMRVGILHLAQGAFAAIRNTATHTTEDLPKQEALEQLATLSILARWIDRCELVTA
ncbi:TIGR02391 family protein [Microbacterium sp. NPDC090218]